jgi:Domain of unknown function (DUF4249)
MKNLTLFCLLLTACVSACVTPYQPDTKSIGRALVVDGLLTDQPGPHTVLLTYTADYTNSSVNLLATGATVWLTDDANNRQNMTETSSGSYQTTASFKGQTGRSYVLHIQLNGKIYTSKPELMRPVSKIDRAYWEFVETPIAGTLTFNRGFNVYIDTKDPETSGDYYRWRYTSYEPTNVCDIRSYTIGRNTVQYSYYCCSLCWDIVRCNGTNCISIASDALVNGKAIVKQFVLRAPYNGRDRYYTEVEQLSMTREAYDFWKGAEGLTKANGGIFDQAPANLRGNITCTTSPDEAVFGYFGASSSSLLPVIIDRSSIQATPALPVYPPFDPAIPPPPCAACKESSSRTAVKPRFWYN